MNLFSSSYSSFFECWGKIPHIGYYVRRSDYKYIANPIQNFALFSNDL